MAEIGTDIDKAAGLLKAGQLVAIPTETVYGLAGNALDPSAVAAIFTAKNRPRFDPLIVHVLDLRQAALYTQTVPPKAKLLAGAYWPGPLTLLMPRNELIPDLVTAGMPDVGMRAPAHPLTRELLSALSFPLAAPSANPFGYLSPTKPEHVNEQLGDRIAYILDGGACPVGIESTVVGFTNGEPVVLRIGGLTVEQVESVAGKALIQTHSSSDPTSPGQLTSHYAPAKKVILGDLSALLRMHPPGKVGVLAFSRTFDVPYQVTLSRRGDVEEAARNLFAALHELERLPIDSILAELVPDEGLGRAINDRLKRAAASR